MSISISDDEPIVRGLGDGNEDAAIIIDSGADVAWFLLSMAHRAEGELEFSAKTKLQDAQIVSPQEVRHWNFLDGREVLRKRMWSPVPRWINPYFCYGRLMEHGWGINSREQMLENGDLKVPLNLQVGLFYISVPRLESFEMKMRAAWRRKYLKLWRKKQVGDSMSMDC